MSVSGNGWGTPLVKSPAAVTWDDLDSADIIVLAGVRNPTRVLASLWEESALTGKCIVYSPHSGSQGTLDATVFSYLAAGVAIHPFTVDNPLFPVLQDTVSAIWRGFPRIADTGVAVYAGYGPLPGTPLVRLSNGAPLVTYCQDSAGRAWIVSATPLGITPDNTLCETGFYAPFIDRIIRYGAAAVHRQPDAWVAGYPHANPYRGSSRGAARVSGEDGTPVALWDDQPALTLETPGLYRIQPAGEPAYWIAAVADSTEGDCRYFRPQPEAPSIRTLTPPGLQRFIGENRNPGSEYLWIALALCMLFEALLWPVKRA
jgi:hypothetical protein